MSSQAIRCVYDGGWKGWERECAAIVMQPRLTELALHLRTGESLASLADAPRLRVLELSGQSWAMNDKGIALAQIEPLTACKELRMLRLRSTKLDEHAVRELFGDRVAVEMIAFP